MGDRKITFLASKKAPAKNEFFQSLKNWLQNQGKQQKNQKMTKKSFHKGGLGNNLLKSPSSCKF